MLRVIEILQLSIINKNLKATLLSGFKVKNHP